METSTYINGVPLREVLFHHAHGSQQIMECAQRLRLQYQAAILQAQLDLQIADVNMT